MRTQLVLAVLGLLLRCSAEDPAAPQSSTGPTTSRATPKETPGAAAVPAVPSGAPAASHTTSSAPPRSSVLQPTASGAASVPASPTVAAARDQKSPSTVSTVKATSVAPGSTSTTPKVMATAAASTPNKELGTASSEKTTAAVTTASARNAVTTASARTTASDAVNSQVSGSSTQPGSATSAKTGSTGGQGSGQGTDKPGGAGTQSATTASVTSQQASQVTTPTPSQADTSRSASPTLVVTSSSPQSPGGSVTSLTSVTPVSSSSPMVSPTVTNQMTPTTPTSTATTGGIKPAVGGGESTVGSKSTIGQSGPPVGSTPAIGRSTLAPSEKPALTVTSTSTKPQPAGPTLTPTLPSQKHPGVPSHTPLGSNITVFTLPTGNYKVLCETAQKPREEEMLVLNLTKSNPCVDVSQNENLVIFLCEKAAKTSFNATRDQCLIELMSFPGSQAVAIKKISIQTRVFPSGIHKLLGDKRNDLQRLGVNNMTFGDKGFLEETEDRFSMPLIITIVSMASFLLLVAALYGCCHQRLSHRKDQQRLTEELQTVENGYHDNPTLEVMETSSEMQEKKGVSLNGELGDSWIVPLDNLTKEDLEEEEDTHL